MQDGSNSKQQIAEKIKQSANILVTVSANPSVDALTAALGFTLMLNKLDKHATAVFSGEVPPAINFLEPGKTFENNVDSLRDFIIALDKDKADRLRYKVEDDVVRIFITPYRTKIAQTDLQFSQGDFNVDLIIALGVEDQKDLDQAITAHGRILHDATVVTVNTGDRKSSLGSIDWQEPKASSLSEMLASIADALKPGILDQQISTALLTGIVANTERFSNQKTTPHVMTIAAQLMAAGANQQLIATKLQTIPAPVSPRREKSKAQAPAEPSKKVSAENADDGEMHINHSDEPKVAAPAPLPVEPTPAAEPVAPAEVVPEALVEPEEAAEPELPIAPPAAQNFEDLKEAIKEDSVKHNRLDDPTAPGSHNINDAAESEDKSRDDEERYLTSHPSWQGRDLKPPTLGGTLNATSEQALEDKMRSEGEEKRNHSILTHGAGESGAQQPSSSGRKRKRNRSKGGNGNGNGNGQSANQQPAVAPAPAVPAPEPIVASAPAPESPVAAAEPTPEPVVPESTPAPVEPLASAPTPPVAEPEPAPVVPEPTPEPEPAPVSEPVLPVTQPEPKPTPAPTTPAPAGLPPAPGEPTLEELERQASHHAAEAVAPQTLSELEAEARNHASQPAAPQADAAPAASTPADLGITTPPPPTQAAPVTPPSAPALPGMPPTGLPPLPPMPDFGALPPVPGISSEVPQLPQLPAQPEQPAIPQAPETPQMPQAPQPPVPTDPAQFRIPGQ